MTGDGFVAFHPFGPVEALDADYRPREGGP